jgi:hypothetical protein
MGAGLLALLAPALTARMHQPYILITCLYVNLYGFGRKFVLMPLKRDKPHSMGSLLHSHS